MDIQKTSSRDFFLYLLAVVTLYVSTWRFIDLLFDCINKIFPDKLEPVYFYSGAFATMRISVAVLIIVFPVYLGVTWFLRKDMIRHSEKRELRVRRWLLNLTLFLAAVMIIADLVTLIYWFLEGELTLRFALKVLVVLIVAAGIFGYYIWDLRRETTPESKPSRILAGVVFIVVLAGIVWGFVLMGSPATQRMRRFDEQRVNHLQTLQGEITNYYIQKQRLPASFEDLQDPIRGFVPPLDPDTGAQYEYKLLKPLSFELCAVFGLESFTSGQKAGVRYMMPPDTVPYPAGFYQQNWDHGKGRVCFERTIDPELYKKPRDPLS